jgi:predicted metal-dependent hydrolase
MPNPQPVKINRLVRSRRKTTALIVELDGSLTVRAPLRLPRPLIETFVQEKVEWVRAKQQEARQRRELMGVKLYVPGEQFWYLGQQYDLEIVLSPKPALILDGAFKLASQALPRAKETFIQWYRQQARRVIGERVEQQASQMGLTYNQIRISGARTRWGSCSSKKNLSFTWRLIMAPLPVVDYVVVHELCHLLEQNHSKAFWSKVEAAQPDYKAQRAWLRKNGQMLDLK